jgi:hypothetical protein
VNELQRFVPNGCEFYQYREAMTDTHCPVTGRLASVLLKSLTVRRKSDGFFFAMSWHCDSAAVTAAEQMADEALHARVGGNRVDLGEANLGQTISVHGRPSACVEVITCIDDAAKTYTLRNGSIIPWADARDP